MVPIPGLRGRAGQEFEPAAGAGFATVRIPGQGRLSGQKSEPAATCMCAMVRIPGQIAVSDQKSEPSRQARGWRMQRRVARGVGWGTGCRVALHARSPCCRACGRLLPVLARFLGARVFALRYKLPMCNGLPPSDASSLFAAVFRRSMKVPYLWRLLSEKCIKEKKYRASTC